MEFFEEIRLQLLEYPQSDIQIELAQSDACLESYFTHWRAKFIKPKQNTFIYNV